MGASGLCSHRMFTMVDSFISSFTHSASITESAGNCARHGCLSVLLLSPALKNEKTKLKCLCSSQPKEDIESQIVLCKLPFWIANKSALSPPPPPPDQEKGQRFLAPKGWGQLQQKRLSLLGVPVRWWDDCPDSRSWLAKTILLPQSSIPWASTICWNYSASQNHSTSLIRKVRFQTPAA